MYHPWPLINALQNLSWKVNPLITIANGVRGAIHVHSITVVEPIHTWQPKIRILTKQIYQIAIQYLTYPILDKRELYNKQAQVNPP